MHSLIRSVLNNSPFISAVPAGAITAYNLPAHNRLQPTYEFIDANTVRISLLGQAPNHTNLDDINNIRFEFDRQIMQSGIKPNDIDNVSLNFGDRVALVATSNNFRESVLLDDGSIGNTITLDIRGGELSSTKKRFAFASVVDQATIFSILEQNKGLSIGHTKTAIGVEPDLYYKADESFIDHVISSINNGWEGTKVGTDTVYAIKQTLTVRGVQQHNLVLLKDTPDAIPFDTGGTTNLYANDNSLDPNLRNISIPVSTKILTKNMQYENIPAGLTPQFNAINPRQIEVVLKQDARKHSIADSVNNVNFSINSSMIQGALFVDSVRGMEVEFVEKQEKEDGQIFIESDLDDGSIGNPATPLIQRGIIVDLDGQLTNTITDDILSKGINVIGLPRGLVAQYHRVGANNPNLPVNALGNPTNTGRVRIELVGQANKHEDPVNDKDISFTFDESLYQTGSTRLTNVYKTKIDFRTRAIVSTDTQKYTEASDNTGAIRNKMTLTFEKDQIASAVRENQLDTLIRYREIDPLTGRVINRTPPVPHIFSYTLLRSDNKIVAALKGSATAHDSAASVNNFEFHFEPQLFQDRLAPEPLENLEIEYFDSIALSSPDPNFHEDPNDTGVMTTTGVTINLPAGHSLAMFGKRVRPCLPIPTR